MATLSKVVIIKQELHFDEKMHILAEKILFQSRTLKVEWRLRREKVPLFYVLFALAFSSGSKWKTYSAILTRKVSTEVAFKGRRRWRRNGLLEAASAALTLVQTYPAKCQRFWGTLDFDLSMTQFKPFDAPIEAHKLFHSWKIKQKNINDFIFWW